MNNLSTVSEIYLKKFDKHIKQLLLKFGSETKDNIECLNHIELTRSGDNFGIKLKNKDIFISDIVNALEDMEDTPHEVKEYYPDITDKEWQSSTRLSTLILLLFEKSLKKQFLKNVEERIKTVSHNRIMIYNRSHDFSNKIRS